MNADGGKENHDGTTGGKDKGMDRIGNEWRGVRGEGGGVISVWEGPGVEDDPARRIAEGKDVGGLGAEPRKGFLHEAANSGGVLSSNALCGRR
jgi:hypothetical protein